MDLVSLNTKSFALCFLIIVFVHDLECWAKSPSPRKDLHLQQVNIGIIGGGIGGTSCAYFLRELFGVKANIDLYEPDAIGGRMATVQIAGKYYESGASVIHAKNLYMENFVEKLGLRKGDAPDSKMGIYNGEEFVFEKSSWSIMTIMNILFRYKLDYLYLNTKINEVVEKFNRIYSLQDSGHTYTTPERMLHAMGGDEFVNYTQVALADVLRNNIGLSQLIIDELATVATRMNYGQSVNMSAFAGLISLAGIQPGLWRVFGGNKQVCEKLLTNSKATLRKKVVRRIKGKSQDNATSYTLYWDDDEIPGGLSSKTYSMVIIATPLHENMSDIKFEGISPSVHNCKGDYQRTLSTFIHGTPNGAYFGKSGSQELPDQIITTRDMKLPVRSLALNIPVDYVPGSDVPQVYKIFTERPLTNDELDELFVNRSDVAVVDWLAYPDYSTNHDLPPFQLHQGLYYVSGVEWAASAMEMVAIAGKNVALLAYQSCEDEKDVFFTDKIIKGEL